MIETIGLTTLTAAGTSTSSAPLNGLLQAVHVAQNAAGTLTLSNGASPSMTLLTLAGTAVAGGTAWYYPRAQVHSTAGAAVTAYDVLPLDGYVAAAFNAAATVTVTLVVER